WLLSARAETAVLLWFAFVPARYDPAVVAQGVPGGLGAQIWTFVTYALIHGNFIHLAVNGVWFLAFGSALARRFGAGRFLAFLVVWFGLNILLGLGSLSLPGDEQEVAWQAHIGGFLAGLLLFPWFDPVGHAPGLDPADRGPDAAANPG